jgi:hypothetical protein
MAVSCMSASEVADEYGVFGIETARQPAGIAA